MSFDHLCAPSEHARPFVYLDEHGFSCTLRGRKLEFQISIAFQMKEVKFSTSPRRWCEQLFDVFWAWKLLCAAAFARCVHLADVPHLLTNPSIAHVCSFLVISRAARGYVSCIGATVAIPNEPSRGFNLHAASLVNASKRSAFRQNKIGVENWLLFCLNMF